MKETTKPALVSRIKMKRESIISPQKCLVFLLIYFSPLPGQASALVAYTFISLASTALVLSIAAPWGGNWWYSMCLISPAAGAYYLKNANRTEEFKVKMVTADDDSTTDIVVEGDEEEIDRFRRELFLVEKGMEYVKGILER